MRRCRSMYRFLSNPKFRPLSCFSGVSYRTGVILKYFTIYNAHLLVNINITIENFYVFDRKRNKYTHLSVIFLLISNIFTIRMKHDANICIFFNLLNVEKAWNHIHKSIFGILTIQYYIHSQFVVVICWKNIIIVSFWLRVPAIYSNQILNGCTKAVNNSIAYNFMKKWMTKNSNVLTLNIERNG